MILRSILAVLAGFIAVPVFALACDFAVVSLAPGVYDAHGHTSNPLALLLALLYTAAAQVAGACITGLIARRRPLLHAAILGVLGLAFTIPVSLAHWHDTAAWYHVTTWLLTMPACLLGGAWLAKRQASTAAVTA